MGERTPRNGQTGAEMPPSFRKTGANTFLLFRSPSEKKNSSREEVLTTSDED